MIKHWMQSGNEDSGESILLRIRKRSFRYLIALLCLINIALAIVNAGMWVIAAYQKLFVAADYTSFYTGYYMVRAGEGENLYNRELQSKYQQQFMEGLTFEGGVLLFANPPYVAIFFSPLSFLRLDASFYLWSLLQLGILIWILISMVRLFSYWEQYERAIMVITILAFWPLAYTLLLGQFSLILLLGFSQAYISMRDYRLIRAGAWLFVMAIKPHTLLLPGMMTLNKRYWPVAATATISAVIFFIVSSLVIGFKPWVDYIQSLLAIGSYFGEYGVHPNTEYTLRGILSNILGSTQGELTNIVSVIILLLAMGFVWFIWRKGIDQKSSKFTLYFAFTALLSVFLSLHLNPHDSLLLVLPAVLFYDYLRSNQYPRKAFTVMLLISPMVFLFTGFNDFSIFGVLRPPVIIVVGMLIWVVVYMIHENKRELKNLSY